MSFQIDFPAQPRFPILAPNGTAAAPSYSFSGTPTSGFYSEGGTPGITRNGVLAYQFGVSNFGIDSVTASIRLGGDTFIVRDGAANTLALRNSTNAQTFRVYNTYTDASNYERFQVDWASEASVCRVGVFNAGTGTKRSLTLEGNGVVIRPLSGSATSTWSFNNSGHFLAGTDNTYDIGASGATRPRNVYVGSTLYTGGSIQAQGAIAAYTSTALPAGGATGNGYKLFNSTNFGVFGGSGAPSLSAAKGSLYLRSDGSGVADRMYVNTDGSTTWTAVATVA